MAYKLRNDEQQKEFNKWWNEYFKQYFPKRATELESNENAMWAIGIAFQRGIEVMAYRIQDALSLATTSTIYPTSTKEA